MENVTKLRDELKQKQAESRNLNIRYVIKQNKIVESSGQPFRFSAQNLWSSKSTFLNTNIQKKI